MLPSGWFKTMRAVDLHISSARFGESLGEMRRWLDHNDCTPAAFGTGTESPGTVHVHVEFREDNLAEAFDRDFREA